MIYVWKQPTFFLLLLQAQYNYDLKKMNNRKEKTMNSAVVSHIPQFGDVTTSHAGEIWM
jgi:hypothetical protein